MSRPYSWQGSRDGSNRPRKPKDPVLIVTTDPKKAKNWACRNSYTGAIIYDAVHASPPLLGHRIAHVIYLGVKPEEIGKTIADHIACRLVPNVLVERLPLR